MKLISATKRMIACFLIACMVVTCIHAPEVKAAEPDWKNHRAVYTIVLDPGHGQKGGADVGALGNGLKERDVNLKIALYLREELKKYDNVRVYMTRTTDASSFYSMEGIGTYAASVNADCLISLHNNASTNTNANGSLVCVPNDHYDTNCYIVGNGLASSILSNLSAIGLKNNGLLPRLTESGSKYPDGSLSDYYSIVRQGKENHVPAIIVEHAFITNASDAQKWLSNEAGLKRLAQADAKGIAEYFNLSTSNKLEPTISKNIDYSAVYDFNYYVSHYDDVKKSYANNKVGAFFHFLDKGMKEGRQAKADFNPTIYKGNYQGLANLYKNNMQSYYIHYAQYGKSEGREASKVINWPKSQTVYNNVDYGAVYNYDYYVSKNPDVKTRFGNDYRSTFMYFLNTGMSEGQQASSNFDVKSYAYAYPGLRKSFGNNLKSYYMHYINYGKKEGRVATGVTVMKDPVTVYNGRNYSAVYNYNFYTSKYNDVAKSFGVDDTTTLKHFVNNGMKEGRQGSADFDIEAYKSNYPGLQKAFGSNNALYYIHYIDYGKAENRNAKTKNTSGNQGNQGNNGGNQGNGGNKGGNTVTNYATVYNYVDYSAVYNYNYYIAKYPALKSVFGNDDKAALKHFVLYGMKEGRQACENFNVDVYRMNYDDLYSAFGMNKELYYRHYMNYGKKEGRKATGMPSMKGATTVYNGVEYGAIYNFLYYTNKYPALKKVYGDYNENGILEHFATYGIQENRQAKENYDKDVYESLKNERTPIMGSSQVTKAQMVKFYKSRATYPAFYKDSDAPTIEDFVQIYFEECAAEGVRADIAFAQAMTETGYLKFGGLVKITDYNFAGLGATDSSKDREVGVFPNVRTGVRAQVQHLKAYASTDALKNTLVDNRFKYVTRGSAPYLEWLSIPNNPYKKGWASDEQYAVKIKSVMKSMKSY